MSYGKFATIYDELMKEAPYDDWVSLVTRITKDNQMKAPKLIDLGCGTGEISVRLAKQDYQVTGVDLSDEMLSIASQKANESNQQIQFVQQDLRTLESNTKYDMALCFCDVLNYITEEQDINQVFSRVNDMLTEDGLFLFDVHSIGYMDYLLSNQTFAQVSDDISYIWFCSNGQHGELIYDLTFFVKENSDYKRFDEQHVQKTYPIDRYKQWIENNGFELIKVYGDFTKEDLEEDIDRVFFVCKKRSKQ